MTEFKPIDIMICYCFTITTSPTIARAFDKSDYDRNQCVFFCGSRFDDQGKCLEFAQYIEYLKANSGETEWTIYAGKSIRFPWFRF